MPESPYEELLQQLNDSAVLAESDDEGHEIVLRFSSGRTFRVSAPYGYGLVVEETGS